MENKDEYTGYIIISCRLHQSTGQ